MSVMTYDTNEMQRAKMTRGLTFGQIAEKAHLCPETISKAIKTGRGRPSTFQAIARVLDVPLASLVPAPASIPAGGPSTPTTTTNSHPAASPARRASKANPQVAKTTSLMPSTETSDV